MYKQDIKGSHEVPCHTVHGREQTIFTIHNQEQMILKYAHFKDFIRN
jgi:hypothetical protein